MRVKVQVKWVKTSEHVIPNVQQNSVCILGLLFVVMLPSVFSCDILWTLGQIFIIFLRLELVLA